MKKVLLSLGLISILTLISGYGVVTNSNLYSGYVGAVRDQSLLSNGKILYINTNAVNAGSAGSPYMFVGDPCNGTMTYIITVNWDITNSLVECLFYVVKQTPGNTKKIIGNLRSLVGGKNVLFINYDPATNVATADEQFYFTGVNQNVGVKFNGTQISANIIRVWNETATATEINNVAIPAYGVADLNLTTGTVTARNDLILYEGSSATMTRFVYKLSNGKVVHVGYGTKRQSAAGPAAMHGFIDDLAGNITDLGFPGSGLTAVDGVTESNGVAYLAHSFSAPATPLTPGLVAMNISTFTLSGTNCPYSITASAVSVVGDRVVICGSPKPTGTTTPVAAYNPATGVWEDWSGNLFTNPGPSSNVNGVLAYTCEGGCYHSASKIGNFQKGTTGNTASNNTHIAKSCDIGGPLPINLLSFSVELQNSNTVLHWEIATPEEGGKFEVEKSPDGTHFSVVEVQTGDETKKTFSFADQKLFQGVTYYRLKMTDASNKTTYSLVLKVNNSKGATVNVYPNPASQGSNVIIATNTEVFGMRLLNTASQVVFENAKRQPAGSITVKMPTISGIYFLELQTASGKNVYQLVVQ